MAETDIALAIDRALVDARTAALREAIEAIKALRIVQERDDYIDNDEMIVDGPTQDAAIEAILDLIYPSRIPDPFA